MKDYLKFTATHTITQDFYIPLGKAYEILKDDDFNPEEMSNEEIAQVLMEQEFSEIGDYQFGDNLYGDYEFPSVECVRED